MAARTTVTLLRIGKLIYKFKLSWVVLERGISPGVWAAPRRHQGTAREQPRTWHGSPDRRTAAGAVCRGARSRKHVDGLQNESRSRQLAILKRSFHSNRAEIPHCNYLSLPGTSDALTCDACRSAFRSQRRRVAQSFQIAGLGGFPARRPNQTTVKSLESAGWETCPDLG